MLGRLVTAGTTCGCTRSDLKSEAEYISPYPYRYHGRARPTQQAGKYEMLGRWLSPAHLCSNLASTCAVYRAGPHAAALWKTERRSAHCLRTCAQALWRLTRTARADSLTGVVLLLWSHSATLPGTPGFKRPSCPQGWR